MQKLLVLFCVTALLWGCSSNKQGVVKVLSNAAFMKQFEEPTEKPAATTNTTATAETSASPRLIAPGMLLTVTVAEEPNWNRQYLVPPTGAVEIVGLGQINVVGLTSEELQTKVKAALEKDYLQRATVTVRADVVASGARTAVAASAPGVAYVLGNVGRPGPLMLPKDQVFTVTKVIIAVGGIATFGNGAKVRLLRYDTDGKKYETRVNVDRIMKRGEFEKDVPVQHGDWIIVPDKVFNF